MQVDIQDPAQILASCSIDSQAAQQTMSHGLESARSLQVDMSHPAKTLTTTLQAGKATQQAGRTASAACDGPGS